MELQIFDISGTGIRFGTTEDGTPYAVASDFAKTMGYRQASDATRLLDEGEAGQQIVLTSSLTSGITQRREMNVIYEDGLWELIFRSSLPGAKAIKARVKAILKEIRETGAYSPAPAPAFPVPQDYIQALEAHLAGKKRELELEVDLATTRAQKRTLVAKVEEAAPKVEAYDKFHNADGYWEFEEFAKTMKVPGVGRNNLFEVLRELKILIDDNDNLPYQKWLEGTKTKPPVFYLRPETYPNRATGQDVPTYVTLIHPSAMPEIEKKIRALMEREGMTRYVKRETRRRHQEQEAIRNASNVVPITRWIETPSGASFPVREA